MNICYKCNNPILEENKSKEHLLQEALGGSKTSSNLICNPCNRVLGDTIDVEIVSQIGFFADLLGVNSSTKHKIIHAEAEGGLDWSIGSGLKGLYHIRCEIKGNSFDLHGKDEKECKEKFRKMLKKHIKSNPDLNVNEEINNIQFEDIKAPGKLFFNNRKSENPKEMVVGGSIKYYAAITKILLNHYLENGGKREFVEEAVLFVTKQEGNFRNCISTVYSDGITRNLSDNELGHVVYVWSDLNDKLLLGYIELFGIFRYLVCLNSNYNGPKHEFKWAYDLIKKSEYNPSVIYNPNELKKLPKEEVSLEMARLHDRFYKIIEKNQIIN